MKYDLCQELLRRNTGNLSSDDYLNTLSRGGLTTPSANLYVAKSFAILDCVKSILLNCKLPERKLSEYVLNNHKDVPSRVHRIITNIYFNKQKKLKDSVWKDSVKDFK